MAAHPAGEDPDTMSNIKDARTEQQAPVQSPQRYEICIRGPVGRRLLQAFPSLRAKRRSGYTFLCGSLTDWADIYGVLYQLEAFGLELIGVIHLE
jgi:hypothetical protein